jgi:hypothetical protein
MKAEKLQSAWSAAVFFASLGAFAGYVKPTSMFATVSLEAKEKAADSLKKKTAHKKIRAHPITT